LTKILYYVQSLPTASNAHKMRCIHVHVMKNREEQNNWYICILNLASVTCLMGSFWLGLSWNHFCINHFKIQFIWTGRIVIEWKCLGTNNLVTHYKRVIEKSFWVKGGQFKIVYKLNQTCFFLSQYK